MRKQITALAASAALAAPATSLAATTLKKRVVTVKKTVSGQQVEADRWGPLQVTLVVKKSTTTIGTKKTVVRRITAVNVPVYPNHTDRSIFINQQAVPYLVQEELRAQFSGNVDMISGATATSYAFKQSLQAALLAAKKV